MTDRQYHDAILHENMMPVEILRAILTDQKLTPDFKSSWRFLDALPSHTSATTKSTPPQPPDTFGEFPKSTLDIAKH